MEYTLSTLPGRNGGQDASVVHVRANRLLGAVSILLVMLLLKQHYSTAGADGLQWILAPTARLTAWLTPAHPVWEHGTGYVDFSQGIIIAPACAGINFMLMAFGLAGFCGLFQFRRLTPLLVWLGVSLIGAYGLALAVNTLRIAFSIRLYQAHIYTSWITPERVHRLAGVGIYLGVLGLFFRGLQPIMVVFSRYFGTRMWTSGFVRYTWLPLGWYLLGAVGVPTVNLLFRRPLPGFGEHCLTVMLAASALWAAGRLSRRIVYSRLRRLVESLKMIK